MPARDDLQLLSERLRRASRVTVITGAGVSAASGIPTFRGPEGIWRNFRPERLATAEAFAEDPGLVWEWYAWRRGLVARAKPNRAHDVLAGWSRRFARFTLVTQNVDGLHERAGTRGVVRFHGSLWELRCWNRCAASPASWPDESELAELPPRCPHCGGLARPGVVWFGEPIPPHALAAASAALDCDVAIAAGTSAVVYPAAGLIGEAASRGAFTAEVNPEATPASSGVDLAIAGNAEEVLDRLEGLLLGGKA
ncbi:MAG TPA: NAD-dependent deacylase [Thermoanaerobaculia bacterium]|jgi:NAD-dependent deacetylase|nr:NAD-dependent deacylase [Thermoanaerobaculia bacterium]